MYIYLDTVSIPYYQSEKLRIALCRLDVLRYTLFGSSLKPYLCQDDPVHQISWRTIEIWIFRFKHHYMLVMSGSAWQLMVLQKSTSDKRTIGWLHWTESFTACSSCRWLTMRRMHNIILIFNIPCMQVGEIRTMTISIVDKCSNTLRSAEDYQGSLRWSGTNGITF